jgi:hypothetical protein
MVVVAISDQLGEAMVRHSSAVALAIRIAP